MEQLGEALIVTAGGMTAVFLVLAVLLLTLTVMTRLLPAKEEAQPKTTGGEETRTVDEEKERVAAIAVALALHVEEKRRGQSSGEESHWKASVRRDRET
ncbi:MAG: OadG family protein [Chloroflexi bacterium]|nr:OadG family protein [Chloroflexota bacterium]